MQVIRCTRKLCDEMGLGRKGFYDGPVPETTLGPWYANLLRFDRMKCVLFVNEKTLCSFLVPNLARNQIRRRDEFFRQNLRAFITSEQVPSPFLEQFLSEYDQVVYGETRNKNVLGSMNDLAYHYKFQIFRNDMEPQPLDKIIHKLNRMPMGALGYLFPFEKLRALYLH